MVNSKLVVVAALVACGCSTNGKSTTKGDAGSDDFSVPGDGSTSNDDLTGNVTDLSGTDGGTAPDDSGTTPKTDGSTVAGTAKRPSYNTGNGFFVLNGALYDANGNEFRMRGGDRNHYDSSSAAGIAKSGANTVRIFVGTDNGQTWAGLEKIVQDDHINNKEVPIVTAASNTAGTGTSCNTDASLLSDVVANSWVATASTWTAIDKYAIMNIANEWGPSNSTTWRDSYITAISDMRKAGYLGTLLIDAGGCGQDIDDLITYSAAVFNSDPQKNIMFALHLYGSVNDTSAKIASVKKGNPTVVTLTGSGLCHPFAPDFCPTVDNMTNSYSGRTAYQVSGALGMTQLNGKQAAPQNVGGTSGAWTITLNVDSTSFGAYTGGGTIVDYNGNYDLLIPRLAALRSSGAAYAITEFGPGFNIGPSPTLATPLEIITAAEASSLGWVAWAWDDNNLGGSQTDNEWFGMTYKGAGLYTKSSDLTMFGQEMVEGCTNPNPGGCGCPDNTPLPAYFDPNNPNGKPPALYTDVDPGCKGTPAPKYQPMSLKLATPATIF